MCPRVPGTGGAGGTETPRGTGGTGPWWREGGLRRKGRSKRIELMVKKAVEAQKTGAHLC